MGECAYGDVNSDKTIVLFGDSKAMQWFPAIDPVAKQRDWRLLGLTRGDCPVATADLPKNCVTWRENMIERIIEEQPEIILIGTATRATYRVKKDGADLSRRASEPLLVDGMVKTIERLKRETDAEIIMIRDKSLGPPESNKCVLENPDQLAKCAFAPYDREPRAFEGKAARETGIRQIDPQKMFCSARVCPPVVGNVLVYRDSGHVTATYSETMAFWFRRILADYN